MITFRDFVKTFDEHIAVDHLTLEVPRGAVVALLGPNGSGKTTSIKAAAGLIRATRGEVLLGNPPRSAADPVARHQCSFLPQRATFPDALTGREVVEFYRRLRHLPVGAADRALHVAALNGASTRAVGTYSGGMLQRLALAVAVLPESSVLLLDEPSAALDPEGLNALYELIDQRRRNGATVLFSSHQLGDVERTADRVAVLVKGRLVGWMSTRELRDRLADCGLMRVRMRTIDDGTLARVRAIDAGTSWNGSELVVSGRATLRPQVLEVLQRAGAEIRDLTTHEGRLDDIYRACAEEHV